MRIRQDQLLDQAEYGPSVATARLDGVASQGAQALRVLACPYENAFNPYTELLYDHMGAGVLVDDFSIARAVFRRYDIAHFHWPEFHFTHWRDWAKQLCVSMLFVAGLAWLKLRGTKVVWTVHNLGGHERGDRLLAGAFRRIFQRFVDGTIFLTHSSRREYRASNGGSQSRPSAVIPHGHYKDVVRRGPARDTRPGRAQTLLYFGQIRPYKNVDTLLRSFARADIPGWRLIVAGKPLDGDMAAQVRKLAAGGNIDLRLGFIPKDELDALVAGADMVVLPYKRILNSGSVLYALSLGRPVLGPVLGSLPEIQNKVGAEWLRLYDGDLTPETLAAALNGYRDPARRGGRPPLDWADWKPIADATHAFYHRLVNA